MRFVQYQKVNVTLSAATFSRLERGNPFNKRRVSEQAMETIRVALLTMYPPRTPEEWNDRSRYQGAGWYMLLMSYDIVCYLLRKLMGGNDDFGSSNRESDQPVQVTLKIPTGLMSWIEKVALSRQSTIPEATVYAIEYGFQVLDSQGGAKEGAERLRSVWRDIFNAIRKRAF